MPFFFSAGSPVVTRGPHNFPRAGVHPESMFDGPGPGEDPRRPKATKNRRPDFFRTSHVWGHVWLRSGGADGGDGGGGGDDGDEGGDGDGDGGGDGDGDVGGKRGLRHTFNQPTRSGAIPSKKEYGEGREGPGMRSGALDRRSARLGTGPPRR